MERIMKPFTTGRKNWLFANSISGAEAAAIIFSFVETCKYHEIEPFDWFKYVLEKIPSWDSDKLEQLLPFNIDKKLLGSIPEQSKE